MLFATVLLKKWKPVAILLGYLFFGSTVFAAVLSYFEKEEAAGWLVAAAYFCCWAAVALMTKVGFLAIWSRLEARIHLDRSQSRLLHLVINLLWFLLLVFLFCVLAALVAIGGQRLGEAWSLPYWISVVWIVGTAFFFFVPEDI